MEVVQWAGAVVELVEHGAEGVQICLCWNLILRGGVARRGAAGLAGLAGITGWCVGIATYGVPVRA